VAKDLPSEAMFELIESFTTKQSHLRASSKTAPRLLLS
jgi:hypothetical protein